MLNTISNNIKIITKGRGGTKSVTEFSLSNGNEENNPTILPDEFDAWIRFNHIKAY